MTTDPKNTSITSLLNLVKTLKRDSERQQLSALEKEARISSVIEKLSRFQPMPIAAQVAPITLRAEER